MTRPNTSYVIEVGGIPVHVTRKSVRNVNIRIHDDGSVHMSVPWRVSRAQATFAAEGRLDWIRRSRDEVAARRAASAHLWRTGETLEVWGRPTPVALVPSSDEGAGLVDGSLLVRVRPGDAGDDPASVDHRSGLVEAFLQSEMRRALLQLVPTCEARVGRHASSITIRRMKTRWGSCTVRDASIRLNTALAEQPPACLEMVLVHELCHLHEANHGPRFHALMDRFCPGWREAQRYLDEHPPRV